MVTFLNMVLRFFSFYYCVDFFSYRYPQILEAVVKEVVKQNDMNPVGGLTVYDLFYRKVRFWNFSHICENSQFSELYFEITTC